MVSTGGKQKFDHSNLISLCFCQCKGVYGSKMLRNKGQLKWYAKWVNNKCDQIIMHKLQAWIGFTTVGYKFDSETGVILSLTVNCLAELFHGLKFAFCIIFEVQLLLIEYTC